jgi:hypothetical protein
MKTVLELMMALTQADNIAHGARISAESGIPGAKEVYMAWGKEGGDSVKTLEAEWKAAQPEKSKGGARGFADIYYDWLAEEARTEQEAHDYIMSPDTSNNTKAHLTHYLNIWALAETVRSSEKVVRTITAGKASPKPNGGASANKEKEPKDTWEYNDADPFADIRSAWENLKRETAKAKPRKSRLHSDKVAKFNNPDLTAAYDKAFKAYCA